MLKHGKYGHLSEPCELIHQWGYEDWFHLRDNMIFQGSVHGSVFSKQRLILLELSSSERLLFGAPHALWVVSWVVRRHKQESYLIHVLFGCNC